MLEGVKRIVAVSSGKGGVGKSTVSANLACALRATGASVGLLDADVYGPSIPKMLGVEQANLVATEENQIVPWEAHGVKLMSMGFLATEDTPVIWRGPMVHNLLRQFLSQVTWGELDYLLIDLPPGTGDAQLTITQLIPVTGAVIITTPQEVSIQIASRGLKMFAQVEVPVLGFVENMSHFVCGHCGEATEVFRRGGTRRAAQIHGVPFLGEIPLDPVITLDGDDGKPTVLAHPDSKPAQAYHQIASQIVTALSTRDLPQSATANLLSNHS